MVAPAESNDTLTLRRRYAANPAVVFELWTQPELLAKWFRPTADYSVRVTELDPRVGGRYRVMFESQDGITDVVGGEYLEVVPSQRLAFTWMWEPPNVHAGVSSKVLIEFNDVDGETELILTHGISDPEMRAQHMEGWSGALDQIPAVISVIGQRDRSPDENAHAAHSNA